MRPAAPTRVRLPARLAGLVLAVLALVSQLAVGSLAPVDAWADGQVSELTALTVLCQGTPPLDAGHGSQRRRHLPDCAPAASSAELALPGFVLAPSTTLPAPVPGGRAPRPSLLSAHAPPSHRSRVGFPRGPPAFA